MTVQTHQPQNLQGSELQLANVLGHEQPRRYTKPLVDVSKPENSYGHAVIEFAHEILGVELLPWQKWLLIHVGELKADGTPRFREVLILVARQNGKTFLLAILTLYWLFVEQVELVMGMSTNLDTAKEAWKKACDLVLANDYLRSLINPKKDIKRAAGDQTLQVPLTEYTYSRYKIAASNSKGGRGFTINRLILDELREHHDWDAYDAATPATNAIADAQIISISNQGPNESEVLHTLHETALKHLDSPDTDFGLFEWSAPKGAPIKEPETWAYANPSLGYQVKPSALQGRAERAVEAGGAVLAGFMTEYLCIRVKSINSAIDEDAWNDSKDTSLSLAPYKSEACWYFDSSPSEEHAHATLVSMAVLPDGRLGVETVMSWDGIEAMRTVVSDVTRLINKHAPKRFGWGRGPADAYSTRFKTMKLTANTQIEQIKSELPAMCMALSDEISAGQIVHNGDPLLTSHLTSASKLPKGVDGQWVMTRKGAGACDAAYAVAGALQLVRLVPPTPDVIIFAV